MRRGRSATLRDLIEFSISMFGEVDISDSAIRGFDFLAFEAALFGAFRRPRPKTLNP